MNLQLDPCSVCGNHQEHMRRVVPDDPAAAYSICAGCLADQIARDGTGTPKMIAHYRSLDTRKEQQNEN